jgi:hypothetical protein
MKDFYDMWWIICHMKINPLKAIRTTFERRATMVPVEPPTALSPEFSKRKQAQWAAFLKKNRLNDAPRELVDVTDQIRQFLFSMK